MDGIRDLGGMHGFGRVKVRQDEPLFEAPWERRLFGLAGLVLAGVVSNVDKFRHAIERIPPADYLTAGYYGRRLASLETVLVEEGVVDVSELANRRRLLGRGEPVPSPAESFIAIGGEPGAVREVAERPRFAVGDLVRTRHSRLVRLGLQGATTPEAFHQWAGD